MVRGGGGGGATLVVGDVSKLMSFSVGLELPKFKVSLSPPYIEKKKKTCQKKLTQQTKAKETLFIQSPCEQVWDLPLKQR